MPNLYDTRQRRDAYWESCGMHVHPRSLYEQQLEDRLGSAGSADIASSTIQRSQ
ncbi:hypothetical protein [Paenibacillus sp. MBLB4367]|uniref:hypothetical protein n=1 Tax=Paenibacillus sp. MBLB4367 TaxID=3384767 RepID=UPI0039083609